LRTLGDSPDFWTASEAAAILGPPELTPGQVRQLIRIAGLEPAGKRRVTTYGRAGRHARVFAARDLIRAYEAVWGVLGEHGDMPA